MEFSLFYFANDSAGADPGRGYELLLEGARFADRNGFSAVWTPERHFHPFGGTYPNPSVTGAALAVVTDRIKIRAGSVNAPLHDPIRIAEEWAVVDQLSRGRVGVSFASGWHAVDFALRPEAFTERKRILAETITTVRKLWAHEAVPVTTGEGKTAEVRTYPRPVQTEIPIWVTCAGNPDTFRAAGAMRANVLTHLLGQDLDELAGKIAAYREESVRTTGERGHVTLMLHTLIGTGTEQVRDLVREPFGDYLRSSFGLIAKTAGDIEDLDPEDVGFLVERAFERYFETGALFGTVQDGARMIERVRAAGVDEVACLIDFGVPVPDVLDSLVHLDELRKLVRQ